MLYAYTFLVYNCVMIEKYYFEFSKIYGRIMRLELQMKKKLIASVLSYYSEDVLDVFSKFFNNKDRLQRYKHKSGNAFLAIIKNPQIKKNSIKFTKLVNIMYLSDILFMVLCCKQFRKENIINNFYHILPRKYGLLIKNRSVLLDLRNVIAHYNFKDYAQNKKEYLNTLVLFESCMERNINGFKQFPKFSTKPSIKTILLEIKNVRPDLFEIDPCKDDELEYYYNKHRILLDLCDDIALYNGYEPQDLPSPWTVLRQMYSINRDDKNQKAEGIDIYNLPLFKNLNN